MAAKIAVIAELSASKEFSFHICIGAGHAPECAIPNLDEHANASHTLHSVYQIRHIFRDGTMPILV